MTYTVLGQDDENLRVTITEGEGQTTLVVQPAALTIIGAVTSVNGEVGAVNLDIISESEVDAKIDALIDGAPGTLDTLNEIAAALNDDELAYDTLNNLITSNASNIALKANTADLASVATTGEYSDLLNKPTIPTDNAELLNGAGYITDYTVTQSDVTQHQSALTVTESQISDLDHYTDADVDAHLTGGTGVTYTAGDISIGQPVGIIDDVTFNSVTGDMFGVQHFTAKARETILAGQPVYISGHSGNTPEVMVADFDDPLKMPAFGIASADIANNNNGAISTYGDLKNVDTTGTTEGETWAVGDSLYVNGSKLTNVRPTLETQQIQKVAQVIRVHATTGQMFLLGAGRSNDTPNLAHYNVFIGNAGGVEQRQLTYTDILNTPTIPVVPVNVSEFTNDAGYITGETDSQTLSFADQELTISNGNTVDLSALSTTSLDFSAITATPTTLSGYGISDGYTDTDAIAALSTNANNLFTGNLTVNGDFVVLEQVKINNFEFPLTNAGRTDQWPGNAYTLNAANAYTKFQLRTSDPVITFDTNDFFDNVNNLRTIYIQVDFRGGNGNITWPANVIWDNQNEPNFATGGQDRHIVVMTGNGTTNWLAYVENVVNFVNPSSTTGKLSHYKITDVGNITDGTSGQVLSTNADGTFSFVDPSSGGTFDGDLAGNDLSNSSSNVDRVNVAGILNLRVLSTTQPASPVEGDVYYSTGSDDYKLYTGGAWTDVTPVAGDVFIDNDQNRVIYYTGTSFRRLLGTT